MTGYDFRVTVHQRTECEYTTPTGEQRPCTPVDVKLDEHLETILVLEEWLKRWEAIARANPDGSRLLVPETFEVLGDHLWKLVFDGDVGNRIIEAYKAVAGASADEETAPQVTVRLAFGDDADDRLASLPWEFVRCPGKGKPDFLGAEPHLVLSRFVDGVADAHVRTADKALRVLLAVTLPPTQQFDAERWKIQEMHDALREIEALEIVRIDKWQPGDVQRALDDFKREGAVDVVHLVAACTMQGRKPMLFMGDGSGARLLDPKPVVDLLMQDPRNRPALVVLHLSEREPDSSDHFEQLGPAFIRQGVPAVMAMQYPMPPEQGRMFVKNLYERLASGERIGAAVQTARGGLMVGAQRNPQFGTPVLYMQTADDGTLLQRPSVVPAEADEVLVGGAPTGASLSPGRRVPALGSIAPALLTVLDDEPQSEAVSRLRLWIDETDWPASLKDVLVMLAMQRRDHLDDRVVRTMYDKLVAYVRTRTEGVDDGH
jgi:hypothetical protein